MGLTVRWSELRRLVSEGRPGFLFIGLTFGALWLPVQLLEETTSGLVMGSLFLQLCGLLAAVHGLRQKGVLFERDAPWTSAWKWMMSIRRVFRRPTGTTVEIEAALGSIGASGLEATVTTGPKTLEERVDRLEDKVRELKEADRKLRSEMSEKIRDMDERFQDEKTKLKQELGEVRKQLDRSAVGNFPWEWVGLGWLVVGVGIRVIAEVMVRSGVAVT